MPPTKQDQLRTDSSSTFSGQDSSFLFQTSHMVIRNRILNRNAPPKSNQKKSNNFTTKSLPPDAISLLNKGTNFIPTTATTSISSLQETVTSKVNTALCSIICKKNYTTGVKSTNATKSLRCFHP